MPDAFYFRVWASDRDLTKMEDQKETYKEIEEMLKPETEKTDAELSLEFLEEYKKLVKKYKRDFMQSPPQIVKLEFIENNNDTNTTTSI